MPIPHHTLTTLLYQVSPLADDSTRVRGLAEYDILLYTGADDLVEFMSVAEIEYARREEVGGINKLCTITEDTFRQNTKTLSNSKCHHR